MIEAFVESLRSSGFKKKLYKYRPHDEPPIETQRSTTKTRPELCDPTSIERGVRQLLADKVCGTSAGLWLLVPEHLRLGTWDLLCGWCGQPGERVEPRLAMQLVHEAALCSNGIRERRSHNQKGFELAHGLPWLASDATIHHLLNDHTVDDAQRLQRTLGKLRRASGHFQGKLLVIDPHRMRSYSKRRMRQHRKDNHSKPVKMAQTFFALDGDTEQPVCLTTATAARTVSQATPELLSLANEILGVEDGQTLVVADAEHFSMELLDHVSAHTPFELLVPMRDTKRFQHQVESMPEACVHATLGGICHRETAVQPAQEPRGHVLAVHPASGRAGFYLQGLCFHYRLGCSTSVESTVSQALARGGVSKSGPGPGLAACRNAELAHPLWTDDHGVNCANAYQ